MKTSARKVAAAALTALGMSTGAFAVESEEPISEQTYVTELAVDANHLSCYFTPGRPGSYIPYDTAWANLAIEGQDDLPVFTHQAASLSVEGEGEAGRLCPQIQTILADAAAQGGKLNVTKVVTLSILRYPNGYTNGCERYLKEAVKISFEGGVALVSEQYKGLAPTALGNCR